MYCWSGAFGKWVFCALNRKILREELVSKLDGGWDNLMLELILGLPMPNVSD